MGERKAGFTLLEIMIAIVLLVLILFSLGILLPLAQTRIRSTSNQDTAMSYAEYMIEEIRYMNWNAIDPGEQYDGSVRPPRNSGLPSQYPPNPYPGLSVESTSGSTIHMVNYHFVVTSTYEPDTEELMKVVVDVYWNEASRTGQNRRKGVTAASKIFHNLKP